MTRNDMVDRHVLQRWWGLLAQRAELTRTAGHEWAAPGGINDAWYRPLKHDTRARWLRGHQRHGGEQRFRVRVIGGSKNLLHGTAFHDLPQVQHHNPICQIAHDPEVVT